MKNKFFFRNLVLIAIIAIIMLLIYLIMVSTLPELISVIRTGDFHEIQNYLNEQSTVEGLFYVSLIQILQIWTIVLSAIPLQFASGIVFDALSTFIACSISSVFSMTLSFLVWKYLSNIIEKVMPLSEKEENMIKKALSKNTSPEFLLFLMCFVFIMPNGLIPIMASKTNINLKKYILAITPGVSFNVFVCSMEGDRLIAGDWFTLISILIFSVFIIGGFWKLHEMIVSKNEKKADQL